MTVRINLLPVRAAKRASSAKQELYIALGVVLVALLGVYFWNSTVTSEIDDTEREILAVNRELEALKKDSARVDDYLKKNQRLCGKRDAIRKLQAQRVGPAKLLDDLATILTSEKKVWLTDITEKNGQMTLKGGAMEHVNISDFQLALNRNSAFFKKVQLVVVEAATSGGRGEAKIEYLKWEIRCTADYAAEEKS
ncbi:MAG: PilN domain-containing protein [Myxococcota bacterium]